VASPKPFSLSPSLSRALPLLTPAWAMAAQLPFSPQPAPLFSLLPLGRSVPPAQPEPALLSPHAHSRHVISPSPATPSLAARPAPHVSSFFPLSSRPPLLSPPPAGRSATARGPALPHAPSPGPVPEPRPGQHRAWILLEVAHARIRSGRNNSVKGGIPLLG
jgi:hypothetical protein